jgi:hypothetical protein
MLTAAQQYAIDQFAKGLLALDDDGVTGPLWSPSPKSTGGIAFATTERALSTGAE